MVEETKTTKREFTENEIMQMAQNEERALMNKQANLERVSAVLMETSIAKDTLEELKKTKGKVSVAIGATILIEVEPTNLKTCKRGISESAYKEENIEDTINWLKEKEEQLKIQVQNMQTNVAISNARLQEIVGVIKQIEKEKRKAMTQRPPSISK